MRASAGMRPRSATRAPASASAPIAISAISRGIGRPLLALARSNKPLEPGFTVSPPTLTLGSDGSESPSPARPPAPVVLARDCSGDRVPAPLDPPALGRPPPLSEPPWIAEEMTSRQSCTRPGRPGARRAPSELGVRVALVQRSVAHAIRHGVRLAAAAAPAARTRPARTGVVRLESLWGSPPRGGGAEERAEMDGDGSPPPRRAG